MVNLAQLQSKQEKICVVGLGYVGLPLAVLLSKHFSVIGFDIHKEKIEELQQGIERMHEVDPATLNSGSIEYVSTPEKIREAKYIIVAVPTPVDENNIPDLTLVRKATEMVGKHLSSASIVVYESTVYPGVTEEICVPILEQMSGLQYGTEFGVGYSPERVNPGDKEHTIDRVTKVVSGMNAEVLAVVAGVYGAIAPIFSASSIRVAEAAKVIENTQRDLNIALMNELAVLFYKMDMSIYDVLSAAKTKWNFLPFEPGLVGGHCIGVDPYYLTYKAQAVGYEPEVILSGRRINDSMHKFVAEEMIKKLTQDGRNLAQSTVVMLGITFKENVPDVRNSKTALLYQELKESGVNPIVCDPLPRAEDIQHEYGIQLTSLLHLPKADVLVVAVAHDEFRALTVSDLKKMTKGDGSVIVDVKHIYNKQEVLDAGLLYWSL